MKNKKKSIDVIISVHVEEHAKFGHKRHYGHTKFFELLFDTECKIPFTLLIARVKEEPACPTCDRDIFKKILDSTGMEIGLHVHPSLAAHDIEKQRKIITTEYNKLAIDAGVTPRSFSGGHWCVDNDTLHIIRQVGLCVDASVVPGCTVIANNGALVKHGSKNVKPYWVSQNDLWSASSVGDVLETPVSVNYEGKIIDLFLMSTWDIRKYIYYLSKTCQKEAYLHMTFHSYDVLLANGDKNYIFDKIMYVGDVICEEFGQVSYFTCYDYYKRRRGEI